MLHHLFFLTGFFRKGDYNHIFLEVSVSLTHNPKAWYTTDFLHRFFKENNILEEQLKDDLMMLELINGEC
jgi:hypothetical protein